MALLDLLLGTDSPAGSARPTATSPSDRLAVGRAAYNYFVERGLPPHQAAAIAGNMAWEGGGKTDLVNPGDNYKNSPRAPHSIGIGQWNDRSPALVDFARRQGFEIPAGDLRDPNYAREVIKRIPLRTQLDFAWSEMQGPERYAFDRISKGGDVRSAAEGAISYHRPAGWTRSNPAAGHGFDNRVALANSILRGSSGVPAAPNEKQDVLGSVAEPPAHVASASPPQQASWADLFSVPTARNDGMDKLAEYARIAAEKSDGRKEDDEDELRLRPAPLANVDLSRIRALIRRRGTLGTRG